MNCRQLISFPFPANKFLPTTYSPIPCCEQGVNNSNPPMYSPLSCGRPGNYSQRQAVGTGNCEQLFVPDFCLLLPQDELFSVSAFQLFLLTDHWSLFGDCWPLGTGRRPLITSHLPLPLRPVIRLCLAPRHRRGVEHSACAENRVAPGICRCVSHVDRSPWETHRSPAGRSPWRHRSWPSGGAGLERGWRNQANPSATPLAGC